MNQVDQFWKHRASQGQLRALRVTYGHIMAQFGYLEVTLLRLKVIVVFQATMNMICLFQESFRFAKLLSPLVAQKGFCNQSLGMDLSFEEIKICILVLKI